MVHNPPPPHPVQYALGIVWRHGAKMLCFFTAVVLTTLVISAVMPAAYVSEAKLFVRLGRENVTLDATATIGQGSTIAIPQSREAEINSLAAIFDSRSLLEQVVDELGPEAILSPGDIDKTGSVTPVATASSTANTGDWVERLNPLEKLSDRDRAIRDLDKRLYVEAVPKSNVLTVGYEADTPKRAQAVVSRLVDLYMEQHVRQNRSPGAHEFFSEQTAALLQTLNGTEEELRRLKNETGVASVESRRPIIVNRVGELEDQILGGKSSIAALESELTRLEQTLAELPERLVIAQTEGFENKAADDMRAELYRLELQEQKLRATHTDEHVQVQQIRSQIEEAEGVLRGEDRSRTQVTEGLNAAHQKIQQALLDGRTTLASLQARQEELQRQLAGAQSDLKALNDSEVQLARLERDRAIQDATYRKYAENLEQSRIDEALETQRISNLSIVQPASFDARPVRPRKLKNLALATVAGIFGAIGLALTAEYFTASRRLPEAHA